MPRTKEWKLSAAAFIVSLLAVVLSQFHPLYTYLDKPKLALDISNFGIYHGFGNIGTLAFVQLRNSGRASGTIARLEFYIEKADDASFRRPLPARTYYPVPRSISAGQMATQVPIGAVIVSPDGSWEYFVNSYSDLPQDKQSEVSELQREIAAQIQNPSNNHLNSAGFRTIDDSLYAKVSSVTEQNLGGFGVGTYYLLAMAWPEHADQPSIAQTFTFSVSDAQARTMQAITDGLHYGIGVVIPPPGQPGFSTPLTPVNDRLITARLLKDFTSL